MFLFNPRPDDIIYDIESYPNCFTFTGVQVNTGQVYYFEISDRRNDLALLCEFINHCKRLGCRWVGFNNIGFDYPVMHYIYQNQLQLQSDIAFAMPLIYGKVMSIINADFNNRFAHMVWESDWLVEQIDLYKIHHFDNMARATSLKVLEFNMRMDNVEDLPFDVGIDLNDQQRDVLKTYNMHDVRATLMFYNESKEQIEFRENLTLKYDKNFMNHNDTKIGKDYFIMELEKAEPGSCYRKGPGGERQIVQTKRDSIKVSDIILPYVKFSHPEFNRILTWLNDQVIIETKGSFKDVNCTINGFRFDFGTGGIHGSVAPQIVHATEDRVILDLDVASYYPNLAIANGLHPEHLGQLFCTIYKDVYEQRKSYAKGTAENAMLKLALNGVYGDSNNKYSPFFDPQYTMSITVNGQLLLCMLAEVLMSSPDVRMIQINTDGLTIDAPRVMTPWIEQVSQWWENLTNLELESAEYSRMFIRDVNNYIAEDVSGKLKRKGAYEYDLGWHQNHSALVVKKAAEAALVHGKDIRTFIQNHDDIFDFFLRAKVPRSNTLEHGGVKVANIVRYFISKGGHKLEKIMPPAGPLGAFKRANKLTNAYYAEVLNEVGDAWDERIHTKNKSVYEERRTGINTGWNVELCNKVTSEIVHDYDINYEWYIAEAEKLVNIMLD